MRAGLALVAGLALAGAACTFDVNVDEEPFSCQDDADCGEGWECVARVSGTSVCHPLGECVPEVSCGDGRDEDCDGRTDCADDDCEGLSCGEGCLCSGGAAVETACGDGVDNDRDGQTDEPGACL